MGKAPCILLGLLLLAPGCSSAQVEREFPTEEMAEGDLAFRCGRGVFSRAVTTAEEEGVYSHIGLLLRDGEAWKVVHAVPGETEGEDDFERVKMEDVGAFFSAERAVRGCLVHTGLADSATVAALRGKALRAVADSVRFDGDYRLEDSSRVYCTEFVWRLYADAAGIDLSEGRRRFIHLLWINGDVLLPEHLLEYSGNQVYYSF